MAVGLERAHLANNEIGVVRVRHLFDNVVVVDVVLRIRSPTTKVMHRDDVRLNSPAADGINQLVKALRAARSIAVR